MLIAFMYSVSVILAFAIGAIAGEYSSKESS